MGYEQLSLSSFVKEMKEVSDGTHPRKFCFVLGAGASRTSGIKSGQELVKIWDKDLRERNAEEYAHWRQKLSITDENMSSFYSQYYEKRFRRCRTDGYNYIEKIMESAKPSAGYVMLAHMLTKTPHNVVITTNFDHLTEDAVNYYAQSTPLVIGHEVLAHYISGQPLRPTVIKIHRDLLFDPKNRTEDLEKLPDSWKEALGLIFANYHPVFIGYAGNDKSLMDFLLENAEKFADDEWKYPYWMLFKTDELKGNVETFLETSKGFYIRHNGFDDVMIELGAAFDYAIPSEDCFLEDARKRYSALKDAIDAVSDQSKGNDSKAEGITDNENNHSEPSQMAEEMSEESESVDKAIVKITSHSDQQRLYWEANQLLKQKDYEKGIAIMNQLIELEPKNARYYSSLGDGLRASGKKEEALSAYRQAAALNPKKDWFRYKTGRTLEEMEQYDAALDEYLKAVELEPDDGLNHYKVAEMLEKLDHRQEALVEYGVAAEIDPEEAVYHYKLAMMYEEMHQYEDALDKYRQVIELEPDDEMNHYNAAEMLEKMGQYEEALAEYSKASELEPDNYLNYRKEAEMLEIMGRHEEALEKYNKISEIVSSYVQYDHKIAELQEKRNQQ